jgi:hypothetical protein
MMETYFRPIAIVFELAILMAVIYSLFAAVDFVLVDLGLNQKYQKFIKLVLMIMGCLALVFFVAHLFAFYPRLSMMSKYPG